MQLDSDELDGIAATIGYSFTDGGLLRRALAHRSWCSENSGAESNERLEFLGDAVLGWAVADIVYQRFDELPEGHLTDLRKSVVNATALAEVAREIDLGHHILLGRGEAAADGADKASILSDAFEAVLGAVYLDGGADAAYQMVVRCAEPARLQDSAAGVECAVRPQRAGVPGVINRTGPCEVVSCAGADRWRGTRRR